MKKFLQEFKDFINQGNVMDLAVAVVIGAAFTAIVNSAVSDLIMPLVGALTGGVDFSDMKLYLPLGAGNSAIAYGNFINAVIQFVIIAFVVFLIVKALNKARSLAMRGKQSEEKEAPRCPYCLEEVAEGATRCPHCTAELPAPAAPVVKAPAKA
ncbi:large conductance mechanosensitive channel protein MscL [Gordonibacter sp. 28C]|uniref:large conductance mechanosensitive channel protein MscL n=1 Tax=Gordonibacter sp. 28C TaxID=2078569 RepID=UPI000DF7D796|nr:large conductance mechanosensitive channel protein MscL [Gordonibacter sp. 28C]RDB64418.1 large conductance mechanosensitive channel protein MscL [Gordonibacter sp. 28C]